jgi:hypothetical protein
MWGHTDETRRCGHRPECQTRVCFKTRPSVHDGAVSFAIFSSIIEGTASQAANLFLSLLESCGVTTLILVAAQRNHAVSQL